MIMSRDLNEHHNILRGGLYGLLLGDAVGCPYEFNSAEQLPAFEKIDMLPPRGFNATYPAVPMGTWTDDGAQALALLDSLCQNQGLNLDDFGNKLCLWLEQGAYTPDGKVFDCGIQTSTALTRIQEGIAVEEAAERDEYANGNGALMRVLPLALWHQGDDAELVSLAIRQGLPTHGHARSGVVCALYCLMAKRLIEERHYYSPDALAEELREYLNKTERAELNIILNAPQRHHPQGTGYVVDTLWSADFAMRSDSFKEVIRKAIALGNDTDTTACVAGGLAGLRYGYQGLPKDWLSLLQGQAMVEQLLAPLLKRN